MFTCIIVIKKRYSIFGSFLAPIFRSFILCPKSKKRAKNNFFFLHHKKFYNYLTYSHLNDLKSKKSANLAEFL